MRTRDFAHGAFDLVDRSNPIGFAISAPASMNSWQRAIAALGPSTAAASVRAAMKKSRIAPRVERRFHLGEHLLDRNHLLAGQIAAAVGKHLIADEHPGNAGGLERPDHLPHIVDAAEPGIGIDIDRHFDRAATRA